jgi:cytochrome b
MPVRPIRVWDVPVRLTHWALVLCMLGLYGTGKYDWLDMDWHFRFGYLTLALVLFRIVWGFVGSEHARFVDFVRGPSAVVGYVRSWNRADYRASLGHNPLGGVAIVLLLLLILAQTVTGLFSNDEIEVFAPLAERVSQDLSDWLTDWHHLGEQLLLILIAVHVIAVAVHYLWRRENLVGAMFSGKKLAETGEDARMRPWWLALLVFALALGAVWALSVWGPG